KEQWHFQNGQYLAEPAAADGKVFVSGSGGSLTALDAVTGQVVWIFEIPDDFGFTLPSVVGDSVYVSGVGGVIYAVDIENGEERRSYSVGNWIYCQAVVDGTIFATSLTLHLHAIDLATGQERWSFRNENWHNCPAVVGDTVYVGTTHGVFLALDAATGAERWSFGADRHDTSFGSPSVAEGMVFVGGEGEGTLWVLGVS
ncbi:MAG: PQQ-binding-like beta-propeller repeat protein, partial [Thermomicrobiales bacterium]